MLSVSDTIAAVSVIDRAITNATPVQSMSGETLSRLPSSSVADVLRYFAGVQVKDYGGLGGLKTVNVRSLGSQHVGVFYDGVRITNAQNGQVDLGRYSLDNLEEVALYNGQKSSFLQSATEYASASSVYLRTGKPTFDGRPSNLRAVLKYGSFGSFSPTLRYDCTLGNATLTSEVMYLASKGDYKFSIRNEYEDTTARRSNSDIEALRAELGLFANPFGGELRAHAYFYSSERGLPGPVVRRISEQYASTDRQWDRNSFLQASWRRDFSRFSLLFIAKGTYDYLEYLSDPTGEAVTVYAHNHYHQKDLYVSAAGAYHPTQHLSMNLSADLRWSGLKCDVAHFTPVTRLDTKAAFAVNYIAGAFNAQGSVLYTRVEDHTAGAANPMARLTPTLLAGWHSERLNFRAFYKSIFRTPTFNDLYYTLVGNASLRPERTRQWNMGADFHISQGGILRSDMSVDIYYDSVHDKIVAMPGKSQFRWSMMNYGLVKGCGVNAAWSNTLDFDRSSLAVKVCYAFEIARDCTDPDDDFYGGQIPYTPWHSGSIVADYKMGRWFICSSFLYTGVRYRASDNMPENRMSPWNTLDVSLSRLFSLRSSTSLRISLDINNVLNRQYEVVTRYPMPGINIMAKTILTI